MRELFSLLFVLMLFPGMPATAQRATNPISYSSCLTTPATAISAPMVVVKGAACLRRISTVWRARG